MKYSRAKAFTEIELYNPTGHNPIIRREITRDSNSSNWILNGKGCQMKEVKKKCPQEFYLKLVIFQVQRVVADMNVQLSNKCQFLPQVRELHHLLC